MTQDDDFSLETKGNDYEFTIGVLCMISRNHSLSWTSTQVKHFLKKKHLVNFKPI